METSVPLISKVGAHCLLPIFFYYRMADQLINQAKEFRDSGNVWALYATLDRYCRFSEVLVQHHSYLSHSTNEKLHHNKIFQEFFEERERLNLLLGHSSKPLKSYALSNLNEGKVKYCGLTEMRTQRIINEGKNKLASVGSVDSNPSCSPFESSWPTCFVVNSEHHITVHSVTKSSPSPIISCTENAHHEMNISHVKVSDSEPGKAYSDTALSKELQDVHISAQLMEDFLELARDNTKNDLETCGILGAFLKMGTFYVTTLIIPKQESTSHSCQALNEEEIFAIQNEQSLFPVGWIHTHPSQSCFMSSVDLHTHYSYQVMVPEAFAIVMAPTDTSRSYGIFRLSDPVGMSILKDCQEEGFHLHKEPADGSLIYEHCSNIYINSNLRFEIFDLR